MQSLRQDRRSLQYPFRQEIASPPPSVSFFPLLQFPFSLQPLLLSSLSLKKSLLCLIYVTVNISPNFIKAACLFHQLFHAVHFLCWAAVNLLERHATPSYYPPFSGSEPVNYRTEIDVRKFIGGVLSLQSRSRRLRMDENKVFCDWGMLFTNSFPFQGDTF